MESVFEMGILEDEVEDLVGAFGFSGYTIDELGRLIFGDTIGGNNQTFTIELNYYEAQNRPLDLKFIVGVKSGLSGDTVKMMNLSLPFNWNEGFIEDFKSYFLRGTTVALYSILLEAKGFENKRDCKNWYLETNEEKLGNALRRICKKIAKAKNISY